MSEYVNITQTYSLSDSHDFQEGFESGGHKVIRFQAVADKNSDVEFFSTGSGFNFEFVKHVQGTLITVASLSFSLFTTISSIMPA